MNFGIEIEDLVFIEITAEFQSGTIDQQIIRILIRFRSQLWFYALAIWCDLVA